MTDSAEAVVDAEVVDEPGTELAPTEPASTNLFRTDDPAEVLTKAQATANALMPVVREKNLISTISGREHLRVEAWTTLGAMLGVTPVCVWTRMLKNGWEARVEARTLDGRVIGAAEAECLRDESTWSKRDDYALRSMAQTRATSKALASVLRFVATLAGIEGTPAEEMPGSEAAKEGPTLQAASADEEAKAKRALGRLVDKDLDRAVSIWQETLSHLGGECPKGVAILLQRLDGQPVDPTEPDERDLS